jgi:hypothetical protein
MQIKLRELAEGKLSIELYIQGFSNGEPSGIPGEQLLGMFSISEGSDQDGLYPLEFGSGMGCQLSIDLEDGAAVALTIFRPVTADRLWAALFELLTKAPYIAYTSEGRAAVASAAVLQELPPDMVESFEDIAEIASAAELVEALFD